MDVSLILKIVGIGLLVTISGQVLSKTGRDEQAAWVTVAGLLLVTAFLIGELRTVFAAVQTAFGL